MMQKVVTCCYCGTRAALVLKGRERHELACSTCGAPLHDLKMLPKTAASEPPKRRELVDPGRVHPLPGAGKAAKKAAKKLKKRKRKKSLGRKFLSEAFDVLEDILD
ncbi:MAG: hypothetical protein ACU0CO_06440 [Shimia sp.]